jgi:hypothetical protein
MAGRRTEFVPRGLEALVFFFLANDTPTPPG